MNIECMTSGPKIVQDPPVKIKPVVGDSVLAAIEPSVLEDSFVYVHCSFDNSWKDALIRIWKTTFLVDRGSGAKSPLIHAENISIAPLWTIIKDGSTHNFILIFSALPKSCTVFDLIEEIPQPGGFLVRDIQRNPRDVYHVTLA